MASIQKEILIDARAETVWAAVRDFGGVQKLFPGVLVDARIEGNARVVTFANGLIVRELLVDVDDSARRFAYAAVGGRATHHNSSVQVFAEGGARSRVVWITDFLPNEMGGAIGALVEQGSAALKRALESKR